MQLCVHLAHGVERAVNGYQLGAQAHAVMGAEGACNIVYRTEIKSAADPEAKRAELIAAYEEKLKAE